MVYFLVGLLMPVVGLFQPKVRRGLKLRKKVNGQWPWLNFHENSQPYWFHCSSGEFEYAKPVIRELKKQNPNYKIIVTYFSPSVEASIADNEDVDFHCPTPWDTRKHWQKFIRHHKPRALLIARTDLWPMMIDTAAKNNIPRLLFSKTVNKYKLGPLSFFSFSMMKKMTDIFCATAEDQKLLQNKLRGYTAVLAAGDTRYDQCLYRLQTGKVLKPLNNFNKPTFVAGSTWEGDEAWLYPLIAKSIRQVSFIIAPHEPNPAHIKKIKMELEKRQIQCQLYSETASWHPDAALLIDQVGLLADLYKWGQFAFIGGSVDRSVHSVMEPLAQGLLCFVGPNHVNNREAMVFQETKIDGMTPVQVVNNPDELLRRFTALYPAWSPDHQVGLQMAVKKKTGASQIVIKWLQNNALPLS